MSTLINRRYGLWARIMTSVEKLAGGKRVVVVIEPEL